MVTQDDLKKYEKLNMYEVFDANGIRDELVAEVRRLHRTLGKIHNKALSALDGNLGNQRLRVHLAIIADESEVDTHVTGKSR